MSRLWIVEVGPSPRLHPAPSGFETCCPSEPSTPIIATASVSGELLGELSPELKAKMTGDVPQLFTLDQSM